MLQLNKHKAFALTFILCLWIGLNLKIVFFPSVYRSAIVLVWNEREREGERQTEHLDYLAQTYTFHNNWQTTYPRLYNTLPPCHTVHSVSVSLFMHLLFDTFLNNSVAHTHTQCDMASFTLVFTYISIFVCALLFLSLIFFRILVFGFVGWVTDVRLPYAYDNCMIFSLHWIIIENNEYKSVDSQVMYSSYT